MGHRLLIVDNDRVFLKDHQVTLESAFEVEVVSNKEQALTRVESGDIACALICVEVAEHQGYAICANIRRNPKLAEVRIALISANASEDEYKRHQTLKGRADLYLMKPIAPAALVAALRPLVPARAVDPDNPLGDLSDDADEGGDWLGDLRANLDHELAVPEPPAPPPITMPTMPAVAAMPSFHSPGAPTQDLNEDLMMRAEAAEGQLALLATELHAKDLKLRESEEALLQIQRQLNSTTVNLEELEKRQADAAQLQQKLAEAEAALAKLGENSGDADTLRGQLRDAIAERQQLLQQVEGLNNYLSEKTQRTIDLIKERDALQTQALEIPEHKARIEGLERDLGSLRESHGAAEARVAELEPHAQRLPGVESELNALKAAHEQASERLKELEPLAKRLPGMEAELSSRMKELTKAQQDVSQLNTSLEGLSQKHQALEAAHGQGQQELSEARERAASLAKEVGGLEATLRGQGRDLAELGASIASLETKAKQQEALIQEKDAALKEKEEAKGALQRELTAALGEAHDFKQQLEASKAAHEKERGELSASLAQKDAELAKLREALKASEDKGAGLEREKQGLQGQLAERQDRLRAVGKLLEEMGEKLRQGAGLTQD